MTSIHSLIKRIQSLEQQHPDEVLFYNKIRVDFMYPPTGQRWHQVCFAFSHQQQLPCYEFEVTAEDVAELEHPDELFRQKFLERWLERHPDVLCDD